MKLLIALIFVSCSVFGQAAQKEINEQVWNPFIKGFTENNAELFMSVHSKDLIRSPRDAKKVYNWDEYNQQTKKQTGGHSIELRFTERINSDNQAIDVGVYKTSYPNHPPYYGRFHVILRKETVFGKSSSTWIRTRVAPLMKKQFLAAQPME
ncbi:MAG: hypothetical protein WDO15_16270 [Bacteroidota bacterium]